jgi:hypothetical protein
MPTIVDYVIHDSWKGGIPPVGTICMFDGNDVKIKAHTIVGGHSAAVWQFYDNFGYGLAGEFAPLRDEMEAALERSTIRMIQADLNLDLDVAQKAFDLGYRKQEPK